MYVKVYLLDDKINLQLRLILKINFGRDKNVLKYKIFLNFLIG